MLSVCDCSFWPARLHCILCILSGDKTVCVVCVVRGFLHRFASTWSSVRKLGILKAELTLSWVHCAFWKLNLIPSVDPYKFKALQETHEMSLFIQKHKHRNTESTVLHHFSLFSHYQLKITPMESKRWKMLWVISTPPFDILVKFFQVL